MPVGAPTTEPDTIREMADPLVTEHLLLVPTPLQVMLRRLGDETEFSDDDGAGSSIVYPREWPGPALSLFPAQVERIALDGRSVVWNRTMVERSNGIAVGQLGFKAPPDDSGRIELGYGVSPSRRGRGYATESVLQITRWGWEQPRVRHVVAECLETNVASRRVLEKAGFEMVGRRFSREGLMMMWEHRGEDGPPGRR